MKNDFSWRLVVSLLLGFITVIVFQFAATLLPLGGLSDICTAIASDPGTFIAHLLDLQLLPYYRYTLMVCEALPYAIVWFIVLGWRLNKHRTAVF